MPHAPVAGSGLAGLAGLAGLGVALALGSTVAAAAPPDLAFHWALAPTTCASEWHPRGTSQRCSTPAAPGEAVVFAIPSGQGKVAVARTQGGHRDWVTSVALGNGAPITVVVGDAVYVAAVGAGAVQVAALAAGDGAVRKEVTVPAPGARAVQLEAVAGTIRLMVMLGADGGRVIALDPTTLAITATQDVTSRAILREMVPGAQGADGRQQVGDFSAGWDEAGLFVNRRGPRGWGHAVVEDDRFRMETITLHVAGDRVVGTTHNEGATGTAAFGLDAATGAVRWQRGLTGLGPIAHSGYQNRVASRIDGDLLVVHGVESGGAFICTVAIADGREVACVDQLPASAIIAPAPPTAMVPALPPLQPIGPQVRSLRCKPSKAPGTALAFKAGHGTSAGKRGKPITWITGTLTTPSATCKPRLGGGIAGDRVELEVYDGGDTPGAPRCECEIAFQTATNRDSKVVTASVRGGVTIGRGALP